jgi:hypothetical protein
MPAEDTGEGSMSFKKMFNSRFRRDMVTDSRLVNAAPNFCLCSSCNNSDIRNGVFCTQHGEFMKMTESLGLAAPIFACDNFVEIPGGMNYLDQYFDGEKLTEEKAYHMSRHYDIRIKREWQGQQETWAQMNSRGNAV